MSTDTMGNTSIKACSDELHGGIKRKRWSDFITVHVDRHHGKRFTKGLLRWRSHTNGGESTHAHPQHNKQQEPTHFRHCSFALQSVDVPCMEGLSELVQSFAEPFRTVTSETSKKKVMWEVLKRPLHYHDSPLQMISQDMTTIRNTFEEEEQTPNETICDIRERDILWVPGRETGGRRCERVVQLCWNAVLCSAESKICVADSDVLKCRLIRSAQNLRTSIVSKCSVMWIAQNLRSCSIVLKCSVMWRAPNFRWNAASCAAESKICVAQMA